MKCPYCKKGLARLTKPTLTTAEFNLHTCDVCNNLFALPFPTWKDLKRFYTNSYLNCNSDQIGGEHPRTEFYNNLIKKWNPSAKTICEVGAATGNLLFGFKNRGYEVLGYEVSPQGAKLAKSKFGLNVIESALPLKPTRQNDIFISIHVIEHLLEPNEELNLYNKHLTPGGIAIIATPNYKGLWFKMFRQHHIWFNPPQHLFYFTEENLSQNLIAHGFKIEKVLTRNFINSFLSSGALCLLSSLKGSAKPGAWRKTLQNPEERPRPREQGIKGFLYKTLRRILDVLSFPIEPVIRLLKWGDELVIVARKIS